MWLETRVSFCSDSETIESVSSFFSRIARDTVDKANLMEVRRE
jgi:hypothetical protein